MLLQDVSVIIDAKCHNLQHNQIILYLLHWPPYFLLTNTQKRNQAKTTFKRLHFMRTLFFLVCTHELSNTDLVLQLSVQTFPIRDGQHSGK